MTIRHVTTEELPILLEGGESFYKEGGMFGKFRADNFIRGWTRLLEGTGTIMGMFNEFGDIEGALGGMHYPELNTGEVVAVELFWYMLPGSRGNGLKLLKAFERWAAEENCDHVAMIHLTTLQPERLGEIYLRLGYELFECHYIKRLKPLIRTA